VLSDLRRQGELAELVLGTPGEYLQMDEGSGALMFEAGVKQPRTPLRLAAGRYRVRTRTEANVYETELALGAGEIRALQTADMRPVPLAQVVRKGETAAQLASGPSLGGAVHGALGPGFSPMLGAQVGWAFELPRFTLVPRVGVFTGRAEQTADNVDSHTLREITAELAGLYVFDLGRLALAPSLSVGWGFFEQRQQRSTCAANCLQITRPQGLVTTVGGWAAWPLGAGFSLEASLELANFYLRRQSGTENIDDRAPRAGTLTYRGGLGVGWRY
jgi:hypothetical protein